MSRNPAKKLFKTYLAEIAKTTKQGDAREESYYSALEALLETFAREIAGRKQIEVTILPKKTEAGNPDFRVWDGQQRIVGYIEAKKPGADLDRIEYSEQLKRYRDTFPNLILTDFYEFRLYRDGALVERVRLARPYVAWELKQTPPLENVAELETLLARFLGFSLPKGYNAEKLAVELAKRTRFLRDQVIAEVLREEQKAGRGPILEFFESFHRYLITGLSEKQCADLYAKTIAYGLFAARTRAGDDFNRRLAFDYIPRTIGILREVFKFISLGDMPKNMAVMVDDIADVLRAADVRGILHQFFQEGKGEDPVLHFYETFLARYDPATRERRGVYYTPEPVVNYIVRGLHQLLQTRFGLRDGLAAREVTLLDPAAGTLTFPARAIRLAVQTYEEKYGRGGVKNLIRNQILRNFYAFEIMMAPYAIGHMKIGFLLEELGYEMAEDERFQLYLTNTLEMDEIEQQALPLLSALSEESRLAGKVKREEPILVILGNPPYSVHSANTNAWTERLLKTTLDGAQSYYEVDGKPLGERNPKGLQDDYVKFLRFAQWKIQRAGRGVVGMITNHGYLDNSTFRGMRQSLLKTFDEIVILNLHGNSLKKEIAPGGSPDKNVFDIRQGVAIALFVKRSPQTKKAETPAEVFYADLWGKREEKYAWLDQHGLDETEFERITPESSWYFFIPFRIEAIRQYESWPTVPDIFPVHSTGIKTHRDRFVIDFDRKELERRIQQFRDLSFPEILLRQTYSLRDTRDWNLKQNREALAHDSQWRKYFNKTLYRPFDIRWLYYTEKVVELPRFEVMRHMLASKNLALAMARKVETPRQWDNAFVSDKIITNHSIALKEANYLFPLYLYPDDSPGLKQGDLFSEPVTEKTPNIPPALFDALTQAYGFTPTPEDILAYIYAVFYSNLYRETYDPFLRVDFPRVPFTARAAVFQQMAELGQRLIALHLLKSDDLDPPTARYEGQGDDTIQRIRYDEAAQRVYINKHKYFEDITPAMWHYQIGGYQVLHKYLKDRKGRRMDHPRRYIHIATAIARTIDLQEEIDAIYPQVEEEVLTISL